MNKTRLYLSLTALVASTLVPSAALANDAFENWLDTLYVSTFFGGHFLPDIVSNTSYTSTPNLSKETYEQGMGFTARVAVGGHVNSNLRTELELGLSRSNQKSIRDVINGALPGTVYNGHGQIDAITLMGNVWVDIPMFDSMWGLTPYVGGGLGAALVQSNLIYTAFPNYGPQASSLEFAGQLGAGVNWAINETISAGLGYRALFINGPEISQKTGATEITTYRLDNLLSHSVGVTLTVNLN